MNNLIKKITEIRWAVLEVDFSEYSAPENNLNLLKEDVIKSGYEVTEIFESSNNPGLYHIHLNKNA